FLSLLVVLFASSSAHAHRPNETYFYLQVGAETITGRMEARFDDLNKVYDLDTNGDGTISDAEVEARVPEIRAAVEKALSFKISGDPAAVSTTGHIIRPTGVGTYLLVNFDVGYKGPIPEEIQVLYDGYMSSMIEDHPVYLLLESNERTGLEENESSISLIFGAQPSEQTLSLTPRGGTETVWLFIKHGFHHILIGFDHVAFLVVLLLPSVLRAEGGRWYPAESFRETLWNVFKIVTMFTIAHSVTLSLSALDVVRLPARPIEILIALSIVAAALMNIFVARSRWMLTAVFALGLLHGLGFAYVMLPLGVEGLTLVQSLFGFNIGVELGQMLIVLIVVPCLFLLRRWRFYQLIVLRGGSLLLILVAVYWFGERALVLLENVV
ncbi:MAG: HupE/UreJ family protein, partial [Pseudomonadota bacterium]